MELVPRADVADGLSQRGDRRQVVVARTVAVEHVRPQLAKRARQADHAAGVAPGHQAQTPDGESVPLETTGQRAARADQTGDPMPALLERACEVMEMDLATIVAGLGAEQGDVHRLHLRSRCPPMGDPGGVYPTAAPVASTARQAQRDMAQTNRKPSRTAVMGTLRGRRARSGSKSRWLLPGNDRPPGSRR